MEGLQRKQTLLIRRLKLFRSFQLYIVFAICFMCAMIVLIAYKYPAAVATGRLAVANNTATSKNTSDKLNGLGLKSGENKALNNTNLAHFLDVDHKKWNL